MTSGILSVVLFCKNCDRTLEVALTSVISQQCDVELLVLDGGSSDGSVEILRKYERYIAYWRSFPDGSSTNAINEGVRRATGRVIGLLAGDDWYEPKALGKVIGCFKSNPELDVLSCGTRVAYFDGRERFLGEVQFTSRKQLSFTLPNLFRNPLICGRFIRKSIYETLGGFDARFNTADDLDFLVRVYFSRPQTAVHTELTYAYRAHPGSRTLSGDMDASLAMSKENLTIAETYLNSQKLSKDERRALLRTHGRSAARQAWILPRRGKFSEAAAVLCQAIRMNWLWPVQVIYWFGCYLLKSKRIT